MIKHITRSYLINLFALWVVAEYIGAFHINEGLKSLLIVGAGFTVLHLIIKPILSTVLGAVNFLTLGIVGLLVDAALLYGLTLYFPQVSITPWVFPGASIEGFIIPSIEFTLITGTILTAFVINLIRQGLNALA